MSVNYREPQWLLPNEKNLQYPAAGATQGSGLTADRHSLYSMDFDGVDDIITIDTSTGVDFSNPFSVSLWAKWTAADIIDNTAGIIQFAKESQTYSFMIGTGVGTNNNTFNVSWNNNNYSFGSGYGDGNWHNIIVTGDGVNWSGVKIYIDGTNVTSSATPESGLTVNSTVTYIGQNTYSPNRQFKGLIDEVAAWSREISSDEVNNLWNSGSPSNPMLLSGKPVAYYPLGEQARNPNGSSDWRFPNEVLQGQAIDFDGSDKITGTGPLISGNEPRSFSLWYKTSSTAAQIPFSLGSPTDQTNGAQFAYCINRSSTTNAAIFGKNSAYDTSVFTVPYTSDGNWHHLLVTYNQSALKVFIDGNLEATPALPSSSYITSDGFTIGGWTIVGNRLFNGEISNVVVWNSDQSANIDNIYNYGAPQTSYTVTPTAWYKLDKTSEYAGLNPNWHNALSFDGSNQINFGNDSSFNFTGGMTVSGWVKGSAGSGTKKLILKDDLGAQRSWQMNVRSSSSNFPTANVRISTFAAVTVVGTKTLLDDNWHHFALVFTPSTSLTFFIDGEEAGTETSGLPASIDVSTADVILAYNQFAGEASNFAIYDQVISPEDIKYLYNGGTPQTNISFEPLSWWKLDNLAAGIQDSGSASNNGTNNGATAVSSSVAVDQWNFDNAVQSQTPNWSSALDFNGSSQTINLGNNASLYPQTGDMSYSFWVNPDVLSGYQTIYGLVGMGTSVKGVNINLFGSEVRVFMGVGVSGQWGVNTGGGTGGASLTTSSSGLTVGQWTHVAVTLDRDGNGVIYIDGVANVTAAMNPNDYSAVDIVASSDMLIGNGNGYLNGKTSNVQVWNSNLSVSQIQTLYNNGQPESTASLSPVSWYKLDNTTTGIQDSGSASNNGTNSGTTEIQTNVWTPRLNGESTTLPSTALVSSDLQFNSAYSSFSLNFDSSSNTYINCGGQSLFNGLTAFSISCWIKTNGTQQDYAAIFSYQSSTSQYVKLAFYPSEKDRIRVVVRPGSSNPNYVKSSAGSIVDGEWVHIVAVGDANNLSNLNVYINGVLDNDVTQGNITTLAQSSDIYIGTDASATTTRDFNGKIDETAVWNRALNQAEITSIYNNGYPKDLTALSPISWWRLGEDAYYDGTDFTIPNKISGAPNGTSDNMPATALVADAPGSYAAGLGSSLALDDRVGDAPLSTANSLSFNMTPLNRVSYPSGYVPTQADNVYSMDFDGVSDAVIIVDSASVDTVFQSIGNENSYSISTWVNTTSTINTGYTTWYTDFTFIELRTETSSGTHCPFYLGMDNGKIFFGRTPNHTSSDERFLSTGTINDGNWKHIVVTVSTNALSMYINGSLDSSHTFTTATGDCSVGTTTSNFQIGARTTNTGVLSAFADAKIDEVAIFDYALSARQIKQDIYNGTTTGKTADLNNNSNLTAPVAWYRMGD